MAKYWVHVPSVGEYNTVKPLLEEIKRQNHHLLVTYFSPRAEEFLKGQTLPDKVLRLPFPVKWNIDRFLEREKPDVFILVESDRFPALLTAKVPKKFVVNARISEKSFRLLSFFKPFYHKWFNTFDKILCKDEETKEKFLKLGVSKEKLTVCGNLKAVFKPTLKGVNIEFPPDSFVFVAGSTHRGEEEIVLSAFGEFKKEFPKSVLVLAPRHIERSKEVYDLIKERFPKFKVQYRSHTEGLFRGDILLVDTLGELLSFYKKGNAAFVGGSLVPIGGHNILEPAYFGKPVLYGPHIGKFKDLEKLLKELGLAFPVKGKGDITKTLKRLVKEKLTPKGNLREISERALNCYKRVLF
jgi:3-deoxy-D-manno-octulosonic-acid transferase